MPSVVTEHDILTVTVLVENLGSFQGSEVVQVYIGDVLASVVRYERQLAGFQKVEFEPQESKKVSIEVKVKELAFYDVNMKWGVEPGQFKVMYAYIREIDKIGLGWRRLDSYFRILVYCKINNLNCIFFFSATRFVSIV